MAALSIRNLHQRRRSSFIRQSSEPSYLSRSQPEDYQPVTRTWSNLALNVPGIATKVADNGHDIYRFFRRGSWKRLPELKMFNVLFSLAKDGIGPGTPVASPARSSKDGLVATVYRQYRARVRLLEPYRRLKNALKKMQDEYLESKGNNFLVRYTHMQHIVHEVVLLEKQYWQLIDLPTQDISETPNTYVLRIMSLLDERGGGQQPIKSGGIASLLGASINIAEKTKDQSLYENIRGMGTEELRQECERLYNELFKLIRKYHNLRSCVQDLMESYQDSRFYPIVPRYYLLKNMIKRVLRAPAFAEICHEASE